MTAVMTTILSQPHHNPFESSLPFGASNMDEDFDPLSLPYTPQIMSMTANMLPNLDYMSGHVGFDMHDQFSNFDSEYYSGDEMMFPNSNGLSHPALLRHASTGFEDPFADNASVQFDQAGPGSPQLDPNHKLLSFSLPHHNFSLLDESFRATSVDITAQLHGGFVLAEPQSTGSPDTAPPPPELTCYRRNLFSIEGQVKVPRALRYVWTEDGNRIPIVDLELGVSASESTEGNNVKLISVPFKAPPPGAEVSKSGSKTEKEPANIPLDPTSSPDLDGDYSTLSVSWKRLQFRIATANNGRRKELQQHFRLKLSMIAKLATGSDRVIAEVRSGPVIVRGRSPRNFASRREIPLSTGSASRRHVPSVSRNSHSQPTVPQITSAPRQAQSPTEDLSQMYPFYDKNEVPSPTADLQSSQPPMMIPEPLPTPTYSTTMIQPGMSYSQEPSPPFLQGPAFSFSPNLTNAADTISLHMSDDEGSHGYRSRTGSRPPTSNPSPSLMNKPRAQTYGSTASPPYTGEVPTKRARLLSHQMSASGFVSAPPMSFEPGTIQRAGSLPFTPDTTNSEVANYSYIPLGPEDWQEPVNGFYAPHGDAHHGPRPEDSRTLLTGRTSSKRYFAQT